MSTSEAFAPKPSLRPSVLIADDQPETSALLQAYLEDEGIGVAGVAHNGEEAASLAGELCPDVVLMDLRMPDVDGMEATRRIKEAQPGIQVIFLTFYGDESQQEAAEKAGAYAFLQKGCAPSIIAEMIHQAWQHGRVARPA